MQTDVGAAREEAELRTVSLVAWIEALPGAPWLTGLLVFGAVLLVNVAVESVSPPPADAATTFLRRIVYLVAAIFGYVFGATPYLVRWSQRDLDELRPDLACTDPEFARLRRSLSHHPVRFLAIGALIAVAFGMAFLEGNFSVLTRALSEPSLFSAWLVLRGILLWLVTGPAVYLLFKNAFTMRRVGAELLGFVTTRTRTRPAGSAPGVG